MKLILSEARDTREFFHGTDPFLVPDFHTPVDPLKGVIVEGVKAFFTDHHGFLITFKTEAAAREAYDKTEWVQDPNQEHVTLFCRYDFSQRCIYIGRTAYMQYRLEEDV